MANPFGRNGRRRRVLNEEMLSASSVHRSLRGRSVDGDAADAVPRYSEAAAVENHPQVTDFVPRRYRTIAALTLLGILCTAGVEALHWFVAPLARQFAAGAASPFDLAAAGSLAAWLAAVLLLVAAAVCLLIYSLRRHRIDDYRGHYRVWFAAAVACFLLSVNSVASMHRLFAAAAAHHTGWTALPNHAIWWLMLAGLPLAWIGLRSWLDARESRLAAAALATAFFSYAAALVNSHSQWIVTSFDTQVMFTAGATLIGHWMLLVGLISYSRFVVLDAQGLIPARQTRPTRQVDATVQQTTNRGQGPLDAGRSYDGQPSHEEDVAEATMSGRRRSRESHRSADKVDRSRWTDGSEPDHEHEGGDESKSRNRKLTKAQRKRLRKLKARNRAA